ncbi:hypothetical protein L218DRAFT_710728 [Marasmius fiardii PR-910]|nr:hypothetical protein L218DRAFT_710728 [Marasmius fiardii PR-910]
MDQSSPFRAKSRIPSGLQYNNDPSFGGLLRNRIFYKGLVVAVECQRTRAVQIAPSHCHRCDTVLVSWHWFARLVFLFFQPEHNTVELFIFLRFIRVWLFINILRTGVTLVVVVVPPMPQADVMPC